MAGIQDIWGLQNLLDNKAETSHAHRIAQVEGLKQALADKAPNEHEHQLASIEEAGFMSAADKAKLDALDASGTGEVFISSVNGLTAALDGKATREDVEVLDLAIDAVQSALSTKASIEAVQAVQTAADGKANLSHTHAAATTVAAGFMSAADKVKLNGLAANCATQADVAQLQVQINDRATVSHEHKTVNSDSAGFMAVADKIKLDGLRSYFEQDATPSSAGLAAGDRWLDETDWSWWIWNGENWVSEQIYSATSTTETQHTIGLGHFAIPPNRNIYLVNFVVAGFVLGNPCTSSDNWLFSLDYRTMGADVAELENNLILNNQPANTRFRLNLELNKFRDCLSGGIESYRVAVYKVGSPGLLAQVSIATHYRLAR